MTVFGYARKNYPCQIALQLNDLMSYGCNTIFVENQTFDEIHELELLMLDAKEEDILVVASLEVFGMNLGRLTEFMNKLIEKNIRLISIKESLDSDVTYNFFTVSLILSNANRARQSEYTKQRLAVSRSLGKSLGRPAIDEVTIGKIQTLYHEHKMSYRDIAEACEISLGTVHKYVKSASRSHR